MSRLFSTTALILVFAGGSALAQTATTPPAAEPAAPTAPMTAPTITAPEGFMADKVVFSADNLDGVTVYDATGERIGEVHGLVFANGATTGMGATPPVSTVNPAADPIAPVTTTEPAGMATTAPATGEAAKVEGEKIGNVGHDATTMTPTDATTPPAQSADATAPTDQGAITQAVIDVGGFLGMGEHRVAIPVEELVAYRKDDELRIYLPKTREQLMALPKFEANPA
ncbi:PRC-barrel domain-containing protein [Paracoccus aestuariivivens]|uniref:Photosystem reaction center protein H n=1 Tax=Paracoccus aestuariivivens TaxID=1820333 RepID=A0A6L6JDA1_9RHOB|nr:PRC-barrel domain-containing protein [Paracoccus aestuariivivens]MTH79185.1 photosystem reaction center protein H [Paracoccus aestuariivivens]